MKGPTIFYTFLFILIVISLSSCYSHRLIASPDPESIIPHERTSWSFFWGLIEPKYTSAECPEEMNSISDVVIKDNILNNALNVVTIGMVNPVRLEWNCSPEPIPLDDSIDEN